MCSAVCCSFCSLLVLLLVLNLGGLKLAFAKGLTPLPPPAVNNNVSSMMEMVPMGKEEIMVMMNDSRRKLGSFQICALCTCCGGRGGSKTYCLASPCCYAINCNIPNRPFGFCSFTPKTCNCFGCHI